MIKTMLGALGGFFDIIPGWVWAAVAAALVGHSCVQGVKIEAGKLALSKQETKTVKAEKDLKDRIAAEALTVAAAVQKARLEEQALAKLQQEKIYVLQEQNATAALEHASAIDRVRGAVDRAAAGASCGNLPQASADPAGAGDTPADRFRKAGRKLADGILQLLSDSDKVARERNLCVELLPVAK
jgi:hypothetical protein